MLNKDEIARSIKTFLHPHDVKEPHHWCAIIGRDESHAGVRYFLGPAGFRGRNVALEGTCDPCPISISLAARNAWKSAEITRTVHKEKIL